MISIDPNALKTVELQLVEAMFAALDQVKESLRDVGLKPHWVSHNDAVARMGWPDILLKKGVAHGHLNPVKFRGKGGTKYDVNELLEFKNWLMGQHKANKLGDEYITTTYNLAQKKSDNHVLPRHQSKRRTGDGLSRSRQSTT